MTVDYKGKGLGTTANVSMITGLLRVSSIVFCDKIKKKDPQAFQKPC